MGGGGWDDDGVVKNISMCKVWGWGYRIGSS